MYAAPLAVTAAAAPARPLETVAGGSREPAYPDWSVDRASRPSMESATAPGAIRPARALACHGAGFSAQAFPVAIESRGPIQVEIIGPQAGLSLAAKHCLPVAPPRDIQPAAVPGPLTPARLEIAAIQPAAVALPDVGDTLPDESAMPVPQAAPLAQPWPSPQLAAPRTAYPWWPARPAAFAELHFPSIGPQAAPLSAPSAEREPLAGLIPLTPSRLPLQPAAGRCRPAAPAARCTVQAAPLSPLVALQPVRVKLGELGPGEQIVFDPQEHRAVRSNVRVFPQRRLAPTRGRRIVQYIGAMAASLLLAGVLWPRAGLPAAREFIAWNSESVRQAIANRATLTLAEDFHSGLRHWEGGALQSWIHNSDGYMRPGRLGLYAPSLSLTNYRLEFLAEIEHKSVDWVVRARDTRDYYAVKFTVVQPGPRPLVALVRYPVVKGRRGLRVTTPLRIMIHAHTAYWVAVDVRGNQFRAFIDGQPADYWTDDRLRSGGVGFFSEGSERARVYRVKVESNDDFLGRVCALLAGKSSSATNHTEIQAMDYRYSASTEAIQEPHANGAATTGETAQDARLGKVLSKAASLHLEDKRQEAIEELRAAIDGGERHPALYFAMGQLQYELQDYESAAQSYAQAAMLQPLHPTAHFNTGVCLGRLERWEEAAEFFRVALANDPARMEAHLALGACLVRLGKHNEALEAYDRYLARYPDHEEALFGKAVALQKHDRPAEAAELYRRLLSRNPRSAEALSNLVSLSLAAQDYDQVALYAGRLADLHPRSQVALEGLAAAAFAKGDHAAAAEYSRKLADIAPQVFENWFNLGVACHKSGDLRTATDAYARATRVKPDSAQAHLNLGVALHETNDLKGARAAYEEALKLDANLPGVHWNLGLVHEQSGDATAAESFYAQVPADSPDYEDALFRMGHLKLQRADLPGSIRAFEACLRRRHDWPEARLNLGIAHWRSGDKESARDCFQELTSAGVESKEALRGLAALALERQEYDKAFDIYHQLIDSGDRTPELLYNAGLICQKRGQAEDAATLYREAIKADPGFGEALLNLGHALMSMGDEFEARSCWRRAVLAKPELAQHYFEPAQA
jgi:tetratricopeptide (TPR) repeat protein